MSNYIKKKKTKKNNFLQGFTKVEALTRPTDPKKMKDPDIWFSHENGRLKAEIAIPPKINKKSVRIKSEKSKLYLFYRVYDEDDLKKTTVTLPDGVAYETIKTDYKEGLLTLIFN